MDIQARHSLLREKLNQLGFTQTLPIGSLAIVSALLDDLLLTNKYLKDAKKSITKLEEEKSAWTLGVEPYKCDNSKLLSECNTLHAEIIHQRDTNQKRIFELTKRIRELDYDNRDLQQQCMDLNDKIEELDPTHRKHRNNLINLKRKPFVSTVRSGELFPSILKSIENMDIKSKCSCQPEKDMLTRLYAEQEANKVKTQLDLVELYKSQIDSRNREISRLNQLLVGGRPTLALAKDCCYRDVGTLAEDLERLQRQKSQTDANYEQAIKSHSNALQEIDRLKKQNINLSSELSEIKNIALTVESEANLSLDAIHQRNIALKLKLHESKNRIQELENRIGLDQGGASDLKSANVQIHFLREQLHNNSAKECELKSEIEKLTKKNAKLKGKLSVDMCKCNLSQVIDTKDATTMTSQPSSNFSITDVNQLKIDRDFYHQEYLKLLNKSVSDTEINFLQKQLIEKDYEIKAMQKQLESNYLGSETNRSLPCRAVESTMHRMEREKKIMQENIKRLTLECDQLRESLQDAQTTHRDKLHRDDGELEQLKRRVRLLESENITLKTMETTTKSTVTILRDEIAQLQSQSAEMNEQNLQLRTARQQLRVLQEQTENALIQHQTRLTHCERERNQAKSRLDVIDSSRTNDLREIGDIRAELNRLKSLNASLNMEKDKLISELDAKTEELFQLEPKMDCMKERVVELEAELSNIHRQINNISTDNKHSKTSLQQDTTDMDVLRRQVKQLKTNNDHLRFENQRITNEAADFECSNNVIKTKLLDAEKEIERLKRQLQQFVQEVQRAEDLLHQKEEQRTDMLEQFRTLSHDAVALEGTNQSLELEAAESKRNLIDLDLKLTQLQIQVSSREKEIDVCNSRICELTKLNNQLELDVQRCKHERDTMYKELEGEKDLCNKLDIEIEKLNAEVNEYSQIRQELEREISKLRNELSLSKVGDRAANESLQKILSGTRRELDEERLTTSNMQRNIEKMHLRIEDLQEKISTEHGNAVCQENLAKEYDKQVQDLRNKLTDTRFDHARSRMQDKSYDGFSSI